ncbi:MAG: hypothetical protein M5U28_34705 [Sandaracinaceae bacterium]|nr:hypothetical protein [Sandaracinaceae bacterium]
MAWGNEVFDLHGYLVESMDITGSILAGGGNAIQIGSTAAEQINLMRGAVIQGNIWSDAADRRSVGPECPPSHGYLADDNTGRQDGALTRISTCNSMETLAAIRR